MARERIMTNRKMVSLPDALWTAVGEYRSTHRINTDAEAIRRLIELGLEAAATGKALDEPGPSSPGRRRSEEDGPHRAGPDEATQTDPPRRR